MKKIATFTSNLLTYAKTVTRQATIYGEVEPDRFGRTFEVSTHNGSLDNSWEFQPFHTIEEAVIYSLKFLGNSKVNESL